MATEPNAEHDIVISIAAAWGRLERRLDSGLSHIKGITFAEYRLLRVLAESPDGRASRVDLADAVGRTPSGVTRALRPLERLGFVVTERSERDARLALARLTPQGVELVADATGVVNDTASQLIEQAGLVPADRDQLATILTSLSS